MPGRLGPVAACLAALAAGLMASAAAAEGPGAAVLGAFPRGEEACYGHVDGPAQAGRHQRVSAMHLFKSLTPDTMLEEGYHARPHRVARDRAETGGRWLSVLVRFRDKPGKFYRQDVECEGGPEGFHCGRDCDGGGFNVRRARDGSLGLSQAGIIPGLRLQAACDPDEEGGEGERLDLAGAAPALTLRRLPIEACHAERDAARPAFAKSAGPLNARFAHRERVCHARVYDADHLARHPEQRVVAMALRTQDVARVREGGDSTQIFVPVRLSARLRDGTTATRQAECQADDYRLLCQDEHDAFVVIRSGERGLIVRDVSIKDDDPTARGVGRALRLDIGPDDRVFRLDERPDAACDALEPAAR